MSLFSWKNFISHCCINTVILGMLKRVAFLPSACFSTLTNKSCANFTDELIIHFRITTADTKITAGNPNSCQDRGWRPQNQQPPGWAELANQKHINQLPPVRSQGTGKLWVKIRPLTQMRSYKGKHPTLGRLTLVNWDERRHLSVAHRTER